MKQRNIWKYLLFIGIVLFLFGAEIENKLNTSLNDVNKCQRNNPTDIQQKRENIWLIGIDGSNEFDKNKINPPGHDTKIQLKSGEKAEIEFLGGKISYYENGKYEFYNYPWENRNYNKVKKYLGESARYEKIKNAGNSVLIILKTKNQEKVFKINSKITHIKNPFSEPATISFFYNGKEYDYNFKKKKLMNTFQWNGCDGSKMYFGIYKH